MANNSEVKPYFKNFYEECEKYFNNLAKEVFTKSLNCSDKEWDEYMTQMSKVKSRIQQFSEKIFGVNIYEDKCDNIQCSMYKMFETPNFMMYGQRILKSEKGNMIPLLCQKCDEMHRLRFEECDCVVNYTKINSATPTPPSQPVNKPDTDKGCIWGPAEPLTED